MERNTKLIAIGVALIFMLMLLVPTGAISWTDDGRLTFGSEANSSAGLTVTLLDENGIPVNMPIVNTPYFSEGVEVTKIRFALDLDATGTQDVDWSTVNIVAKFYIVPYSEAGAQAEQFVESWTFTSQAFTESYGVRSVTQMKDFALDELSLIQTSIAVDGEITWKFKVKVLIQGFIFDTDGVAINADPYTGFAGPIILTTPAGGTEFDFSASLNTWFP